MSTTPRIHRGPRINRRSVVRAVEYAPRANPQSNEGQHPACGSLGLPIGQLSSLGAGWQRVTEGVEHTFVSPEALYFSLTEQVRASVAAESAGNALTGHDPLACRETLRFVAYEIESRLPWVSETDGRPRGMRVVSAGYLGWNHPRFPPGTPFVAIGVDSWEAARAVRAALVDVARLDDASWDLDWESCDGVFRMIRVFPEAEAFGSPDS
jgi:hypothetical protein